MEEGEDKQLVLSLFLLLIGTTIPPSAKKGSNLRNRTSINHDKHKKNFLHIIHLILLLNL